MGWPEVRRDIETQVRLFEEKLRQWHGHQASLAEARGQLESTIGTAHHQLARDGLQTFDRAPRHAGMAAKHLARAIQLCHDYLHAVDPDNADGSIRGLPSPEPHGPPHGGHGGSHVPAARRPTTDVSRRRSHVFTEQGGQAGQTDLRDRDNGIVDLRREWLRDGGHAVDRHGGQVTDQQLQDRLLLGRDPITGNTHDWEHPYAHRCGQHATAFTSDGALVYAEMRVYDSPQAQAKRVAAEQDGLQSFKVRVAAIELLGPDFRDSLRGWTRLGPVDKPTGTAPTRFPDSTQILVMYRRSSGGSWAAYTCYPDIPRGAQPHG